MDDGTATKVCTKCGERKPLDGYYPRQGGLGRLTSDCKECIKARRRAYAKANRAKESAATAAYRGKNPEAYREYMQRWRSENKDKMLAQHRAWREKNRDHLRALKQRNYFDRVEWYRGWRERNPERARGNQRAYDRANLDARRERQARRRAQQLGSAVGPVDTDALWTGLCGICEEVLDTELRWPDPLSKSLDHITPLSMGGPHVQDNLQWTHLFCNVSKGARCP